MAHTCFFTSCHYRASSHQCANSTCTYFYLSTYMKSIFIAILAIQISVIIMLANHIYTKNKVLGVTSVNPIQTNTLLETHPDGLQYFYEPKPDTIIKPEVIFPGLENISYHINKDGLNQFEDYATEKSEGIYRIITLGDSHTFGQNVNTIDNYPFQLQQMLNERLSCSSIKKFEVINLGVAGYDFQYTVQRFKLRGEKYNPDLVIWLLVPDDFGRILEKLMPSLQEHIKRAKETGEYEENLSNGIYYTEWKKAKNEAVDELGGEDSVLHLQETYLRNINNYYSGPLLFTFYPIMPEKYIQILEDFQQERKNTYIHGHLPNIYQKDNLLLPDRHPNRYGYQLIAENLMTYLQDKKILNCYFNH